MSSRSRSRKNIDKLGPDWSSRLEEARSRRAAALAAKSDAPASEQPKPWEILGEPATPTLIDESGGAVRVIPPRPERKAKSKPKPKPETQIPNTQIRDTKVPETMVEVKSHPIPESQAEPETQFKDADVFAMDLPGPETDAVALAPKPPRKINIAKHAEEEPERHRVAAWIAAGVFLVAAGGLTYSAFRFSQGIDDIAGLGAPATETAIPQLPDVAPNIAAAPLGLRDNVGVIASAPVLPSALSLAAVQAPVAVPPVTGAAPDAAFLAPLTAGPNVTADLVTQVAPPPVTALNLELAPTTTLAALVPSAPTAILDAVTPEAAPTLDLAAPQPSAVEPDLAEPLPMQVAAPATSNAPVADQSLPELAALAPNVEAAQPLSISGAVAPGAAPLRLDLAAPQTSTSPGTVLLPPLPMQVAAPTTNGSPASDDGLPQLAALDVGLTSARNPAPTIATQSLASQPTAPLGLPLASVQISISGGAAPAVTSVPVITVVESGVTPAQTPLRTASLDSSIALPAIPAALPRAPVRVALTLPELGTAPVAEAPDALATVDGGPAVDATLVALAVPQGAEFSPEFGVLAVPPEPLPTGITVVVHAPDTADRARVESAAGEVASATRFDVSVRPPVDFAISSSNVRYFHAEDRAAAETVATQLNATLRDFTDFSPLPATGTIEVWLEGAPAATRPAPQQAVAAAAPRRQTTTPAPASAAAKPVFKTKTVTRTRSGAARINGQ